MSKQLLTKNQLKVVLNISLGKLNTMMRNNEIPYYKIGRCVRFDILKVTDQLQILNK
jgi:excisionase family DNA binding protein